MDGRELNETLTRLAGELVGADGPGLAVGVYRDGALVAQAAAGLACIEFGIPVDQHTRFDIASMSKQFTAVAALSLCRDGELDLAGDIRTHLPELRFSEPVTVGQCLRHTGGLPDYLWLSALAGRPMTRITQDQALAFIARLTGLNFRPESEFDYSNSGYVLIASILQRVTGKTLREFAAERIFRPLGMTETFFRDDSREVVPRLAYGYLVEGDRVSRSDSEECLVGDGALVTSIADLGPWYGFLADGRVLGADLRDALLAQVGPPGSGPREYAHGIYHARIGGHHVVGHSGGVLGYRSQLYFDLDAQVGIAMLTNDTALDPAAIGERLIRLAAGLPDADQVHPVDGAAEAAELAGHWIATGNDLFLHLVAREGGLLMTGGPLGGEFRLDSDGSWHGQGARASARIRVSGSGISVGTTTAPGRARAFRRCAGPDPSAVPPAGVWRSPELGTLISIDAQGRAELGLDQVAMVQPAPDCAFRAADFVLRPDGDDLLVSTYGVSRMRFAAQPPGTVPIGVPAGLNLTT